MALVLSLAVLGVGAQSASAAWRFVGPGGSDPGNDCTDQWARCATIQHAIDVAEEWETVDVGAGEYDEDLTIDKTMHLTGPGGAGGRPAATIDGGLGTAIEVGAEEVEIRGLSISAEGTGTAIRAPDENVDGLRIQENAISGGSAAVRIEAGGERISIGFNLIEAVGDGIRLDAADYSYLAIRANEFVGPIGEYAVLAEGGGTIKGLEFDGNEMPARALIAARVEKQPFEESSISANSFESASGPQLAVNAHQIRLMENSFDGHGAAGCLQILGNQGGHVPSEGILLSGNEFIDCNPYGIELEPEVNEISIYANEFAGSYDGIAVSDASPWNVTGRVVAEDNRIVGTTHLGVDNQASGTLDATQNWWGCNAGPGGEGCDATSAGVDAGDNVRLIGLIGPRVNREGFYELPTGSSITLKPGEKAEVVAVLTANGGGINLGVPTDGFEAGFSSSLGTFYRATERFGNGYAQGFFTAGSTPGQGSIVISLDNQRTIVPVTIPGDGQGNSPPKQAKPKKVPLARITASSRRVVPSGRRVVLGLVSCPTSCRVHESWASVVVGRHRYRSRITPRGRLGDGSTTPIRLLLPKPALRVLGRVGIGRLSAKVTVTNSIGQVIRRTIAVKLESATSGGK